jgi:hypothetical protein
LSGEPAIRDGSALVDAAGVVTVELGRVRNGYEEWAQRIVVDCTSTSATFFGLYRGATAELAAMIDGTTRGNFNVADEGAAGWIPPGTLLLAQWTGASALDAGGNVTRGRVALQVWRRKVGA